MNGHALRELAKAWAMVAHEGVSRKGAGEPYFDHCEAVASRVWGWRRKALAYLHDVIEDAEDPPKMFWALSAVYPQDFMRDLLLLSRLPKYGWLVEARTSVDLPIPEVERGEKPTYEAFIAEILERGSLDAVAVKNADMDHNLEDIEDVPEAQGLRRRYLRFKPLLEERLANS